jgi:DNA repair ATPase RecN
LEKVSSLRQTIGNLQELSGLTKELHKTFQSDIKELAEEVHGQFEGFADFETQQEQVTALEEKIRVGKEKADALTARLEDARRKVDERAKLEADWEATTSRAFHSTLFYKMFANRL